MAWALSWRCVVGVPVDVSACASRFSLVLLAFAFVPLAFSFAFFALVGVECIAASRFSVGREAAILTNKVVGEGREIAREDVVVAELPSFNEGVELRPALDEFIERLNFGDVGYLLVKAPKGFIVVDVVGNVIEKVFEVVEGAFEVGFHSGDVL